MANTDDKYADYLIDRFRKLGSNTSRWALLFFVAIFYTWLSSIYTRTEYINNYITVTKKRNFFDTLSSDYRTKRRSYLRKSRDTLERYSTQREIKIYDTSFTQSRDRYHDLVLTLKQAENVKKDPNRLKKLLQLKEISKGAKRRKIKDTIKKEYLPIDVLIAMSERQKELAEKQKDSLVNKMAITFSVPGLSSLSFGFRIGLTVWMILSLTLLFYLFHMRLLMIQYLKDIYKALKHKFGGDTYGWHKTDLQVPIWFAPVTFKPCKNERVYRTLLGWKYIRVNNAVGLLFISIIIALQTYVAWLSWHVAVLPELKNTWFQITCITLVFLSFFIVLLWTQPINFSSTFPVKDHLDFKRREFLKLTSTSLIFLLLIPSLGKAVPLMQGKFTRKKRLKKNFPKTHVTNLADGFYKNKSNRRMVIHYFSGGNSLSLKTIPEARQQLFLSKLAKIEIAEVIHYATSNELYIPHWPLILEKQAYIHAVKEDYVMGVEILLFALAYSIGRGSLYTRSTRGHAPMSTMDGNEVTPLQNRLKSFLVGLILRAERRSSQSEVERIWTMIKKRLENDIPERVLKKDFILFYRNKNYYVRKWQTADKLHWHLPKTLYL